MKENELGGACCTHRDKKCIQSFWSENLKGRDYSEKWEDNIKMALKEVG
jgi:hypothetical protein